MPSKLKICGITQLNDALYCDRAGADFLGFIFYSASPRNILVETAASIVSHIRHSRTIGVFVDQSYAEIMAVAVRLNLWGVQIYQHFDQDFSAYTVIRVVHVQSFKEIQQAETLAVRYPHDFVLLDQYHALKKGGTGTQFNWNLLPKTCPRFFLAGGIHLENIADVLAHEPFAVDVVSGTEACPGKKDFYKIDQLIERSRE